MKFRVATTNYFTSLLNFIIHSTFSVSSTLCSIAYAFLIYADQISEDTKENHNRVVSVYVIQTHVPYQEILLNIFCLRKRKLSNFRRELAYKVVRLTRHLQNSQYVLYRMQNTRLSPRSLYSIKYSWFVL